jgi:large subunit ribosomal protein L5
MERLYKQYRTYIIPTLQKELGLANTLAVPRLVKVSVNIGISKALKDSKYLNVMIDTLQRITGQQPVKTLARKAVSGFGIRQGMVVGLMVTLRRKRMYDFLEKLVRVVLPRVRDFQGIPDYSVDAQGNLAMGFKEHMVFPEINPDEVEKTHGLEVSITTTAGNQRGGRRLFELLGIPFRKEKRARRKKRRMLKSVAKSSTAAAGTGKSVKQ